MTEPTPAQIDALAAVIRQVDGNHSEDAALLAEAILECWVPPAKVAEPTIGQISDLADAIRSHKAVKDYWLNYFGRDSFAAVLSRLDGNHSRGAAALAEEILRHWQPPQSPTLSTEKLYREIDQLLGDMTRCSDHPEGGWWETEDGVKVGRIKLRELKELITRHLSPPQP